MIDDVRFARILTVMAETLPMFGRDLTDRTREAYWLSLADLSDDDFEFACTRCMRELKAFPTPVEILERRPAQDDLEVRAARAFQGILRSARHSATGGTYWHEGEIAAKYGTAAGEAFVVAGATGGFRAAMDPDRERFIRRDFIAAFVRLAKADPTALLPAGAPAQLHPEVAKVLSITSARMALPPKAAPSAQEVSRKRDAFRGAVKP